MYTINIFDTQTIKGISINLSKQLVGLKQAQYKTLPKKIRNLNQFYLVGSKKQPQLEGENGLYDASIYSNNRLDIEHACELAAKYNTPIGFVIEAKDGIFFIDLDIKDSASINSDGQVIASSNYSSKEHLERVSKIVEEFDTYAEISLNGKGVHLYGMGEVKKSVKRGNVEIYGSKRFVVCTGRGFEKIEYQIDSAHLITPTISGSPRPLAESVQDKLENMISQMSPIDRSIEVAKLEEIDPVESDRKVIERARSSDNHDKYLALSTLEFSAVQKKYPDQYPSQSEGDMALLAVYAFHTKSNDQCRRLFRQAPMGRRAKAIKNDNYLNRTLVKIRAREKADFESVDEGRKMVESLIANESRKKTLSGLKFASTEIDWPPGFVGELAHLAFDNSYLPQKKIAILIAIAVLAGVCGRSYRTPTKTDVAGYFLLVARSAIGKDAIHEIIPWLLKISGVDGAERFLRAEKYVSGPALQNELLEHQGFLNLRGEFGRDLIEFSNRRNTPMQDLRTILTMAYSKMTFEGRSYSDREKSRSKVMYPALSFLGESTIETFYNSLTDDMLHDGFLSRFTIFQVDSDRPKSNSNRKDSVGDAVQKHWRLIVAKSLNIQNNYSEERVIAVQFGSPEAKSIDDEFEERCRITLNAEEDERIRQPWNRAHIKVLKIASLLAIADNPNEPKISVDHFNWARALILSDITNYLDRLDRGEIGNSDRVREKRIIAIGKKYFSGMYTLKSKEQLLRSRNVITRSRFFQSTNQVCFTDHPYGHSRALDQTLSSLCKNGYLVEVDKAKASENYGFTGVCYLLGNNFPETKS